jgi:polyisoprenoid-binding protein YceI
MKNIIASAVLSALLWTPLANAEEYVIDTEKAHAFIQFKIQHLGFSWLYGRFNDFSGEFSYDEQDPASASINVAIDVTSIDSNHAERDKHLRGEKFMQTDEFPDAKFVSTSYEDLGDGKGVMKGDFTFHGVTNPISIDVVQVGAGDDPWGGYRRGFYGTTSFKPSDYGMDIMMLGPKSQEVFLELSVEGIRK